MRDPRDMLAGWSIVKFLAFQLIIGGKILSMLINPLMWGITLSYFIFRATLGSTIESFFPQPVLYMGVFCLVFGNFLYMYYYIIGCAKRKYDDIIKYMFLVPLYWLAMSYAAMIAVNQVITKPHYWAKTVHGLHLKKEPKRRQRRKFKLPALQPTIERVFPGFSI
jgi:hypothetical protein